MGRQKSPNRDRYFRVFARAGFSLLLGLFLIPLAQAKVFDFTLSPYFSVSQIYSDNLSLGQASAFFQSTQPQGGFVTQLAPGINVSRKSARSTFNLSYRLQSLFYEGIDYDPRVFSQLQMNSKTALYDKSVYLDSFSTIGQINASSIGAVNPDNIARSPTFNSTNYRSFRISPYWLPHFGGYADGEIRVGYNYFSNGSTNGINAANNISNLGSNSYFQSIYFNSGRRFVSTGLGWRLSMYNQDYNYQASNTSSVNFRNVNGEMSYRLITDVNGFVQSGYYDNSYPTNFATQSSIATHNGVYITPGLSWAPSPKFSIAAGYGINAYFTNLMWNPSQRTNFHFMYRNSQVGGQNYGLPGGLGIGGGGLVQGNGNMYGVSAPGSDITGSGGTGQSFPTGQLGSANAGSNWNVGLQHRTRSTSWNASYFTTTSTLQQLIASQSTFTTPTDINGNQIGDPTANGRAINLPNVNVPANNVMLSKRASLQFSWFLSRSTFMLNAYQSNFTYSTSQLAAPPQSLYGLMANWTWRFSPRTSATLMGTWQSSEYQNNASVSGVQKTDFLNASLTVNRQLSSYVNANLQYSYFQSSSNNTGLITNLVNFGSYDSNRITASLYVSF